MMHDSMLQSPGNRLWAVFVPGLVCVTRVGRWGEG
jgi:hypothetical protein